VGERVFERLRRRYSCVVIDAPPVLAVAEGMLLQKLVDSTVLVVRARVTPREWLRRAMENVDFSRLAGVVLTDVDGRPVSYAYRGYEPMGGSGKVTA
jgi:Mrp family chromosome partitioning ATPase